MSTESIINENAVQSYLSFRLEDELFALGVNRVIEILEVPKITKIPRAPNYMTGVINLRGSVLPLVDTRIKFGMSPLEFTVNTCIVVMEIDIEGESIQLGALVDAVLEVLEVDESTVQTSPSIDAKYRLEFIKGMVHIQDKFIMLLNIDEVFSLENIEQLKVSKEMGAKEENKNKKKKAKDETKAKPESSSSKS
ncbi:MAG: chemotaxis protein CheW [Cyclobacteriaceae bacterium]|nr:chemotaxis protein CheW [Cyclobacteriaceae bacterium]